jgi:low temperature requirement protein LtrA
MFLAAAIFAVASLIWLTQALVDGIDVFIQRKWLSALIVGALLAAIAGVLAMVGKSKLSATSLTPNRTVRSLKRDGEVLTERVS